MPCHPDPIRLKERDLSPRQRWIAAQRLAAGDSLRLAAVMANTNSAVLSLLLNEDPEFQGLIEDGRAIHAMPRDEWCARAEAFARDAAERAMVDGRVSTLNLCLKASGLLAGTAEDAADDDPLQAWMDGLSDEEWAEYEALGDEDEQAEVMPAGCDEVTSAETAEPVMPTGIAAVAEPPSATFSMSEFDTTAAPALIVDTPASGHDEMMPAGAMVAGAAVGLPAFPEAAGGHVRVAVDTSLPGLAPWHGGAPGRLPPATAGPRRVA
jgi:hypothetical protein